MSILKIALLQLMPGADAAENREIGLRACREAKEMGADIALFPEMWSSGYRIPATAGRGGRAVCPGLPGGGGKAPDGCRHHLP